MSNVPSRAALILLQHGISGAELARELSLTRAAVSLHLTGKTSETSRDLLTLIEKRAGSAVAEAVAEAIAEARDGRLQA